MKTLKLSVALAMSFAAILAVSGYVGYTSQNTDANNFKSHIYIASCADPMDDLCDIYKPTEKEIREKIVSVYSLDVDKFISSEV